MDDLEYQFATQAIREGHVRTNEGEQSEALFLTSSYVFSSAKEAAARFSGAEAGNIYSRFTNPTVKVFEQRLAAMEGGERCIAFASGMAAIMNTCLALVNSGEHLVVSRSIFGTTVILFQNILKKLGIECTFVALGDMDAWQQAIRPNTRLLFMETPSNPLLELADIKALSAIAHAQGCYLAVDNCLSTPALQLPIALGADIVIHSATKYLDGQGRCIGGAVVGKSDVLEPVFALLRSGGACLSPFNAWVFLKGLETLQLRMQAHSQSALILARWLHEHPKVAHVYYPSLDNHPQHALAKTQQKTGGGLVSFVLKGGQKAAWHLIDSTKMLSITANLGDTKSTITHSASTTHNRLTPEQRAEAGVSDGLVRIAVGLEAVEDIQRDVERGL